MAMTTLNLNTAGGQSGAGTLGPSDAGIGDAPTGLDALLREPSLTFDGANARGLANTPMIDGEGEPPPIDVIGKRQLESLSDVPPPYLRVHSGDFFQNILNGGSQSSSSGSVATEVTNEANRPEVEAAKKKIEAELKTLKEKLDKLPDSTTITKTGKDGKPVVVGTVGELKQILKDIKIVVTDKKVGSDVVGIALTDSNTIRFNVT